MSNNNKIKPVGKRLLLKPIEDKETLVGGIYIPDSSQKKSDKMIVVANGDSKSEIKVGETVLIGKYGGTEIKVDGEKYTLVLEEDVLAVIG